MVRGQKGEPSTLEVDIMDGSISRGEPSTLKVNIMDGSISKGEPSTLYARIVEGSYLKHELSHEAPRADEVCDGGISRRAENSEAPACGDGAHGAPSPVMGAGGGNQNRQRGNQNRGRLSEKYTSASATHDRALQNAPRAAWYRLFGQPGGGSGEKQKKQ